MSILNLLGGGAKAIDTGLKLVAIIIAIVLLRRLYLKFVRRNAGRVNVDQSQLMNGRNYDNIAKQVHDLRGFFTSGEDVNGLAAQLNRLNDEELKQVSNRYLILYGKGKETLQDALSDMLCWFCDDYKLLLNRLDALNLN